MLGMIVSGLVILYQVRGIQQWDQSTWDKLRHSEKQISKVIEPTRGNIYSDNGSLLATSVPFYTVAMDPTVASDELFNAKIDSLALLFSQEFPKKSKWQYKHILVNARKSKRRYVRISNERINHLKRRKMEAWPIVRRGKNRGGVIFETINKRYTPFKSMAYRTIGYINDNHVGAGLEYSFDKTLRGVDGFGKFRKVAGGAWRMIHDENELEPINGDDIHTTINVNIQDVTEAALKRQLAKVQAKYGCAIVMETATGEVKAISNFTKNADGDYIESYNYAVGKQGKHEPGSTFKLASMIALLEEKQLNLTDTIDTGDGEYRFAKNAVMRDSKVGGYGNLTIQGVFEHSSNIGVSRLIDRVFGLNEKKYIEHLKETGILDELGFQLQGYGTPFYKEPTEKDWSGTTLPWMSIGYEVQITPLQTLTLYNAVANNGTMLRPRIVKSISNGGRTLKTFEPEVMRKHICSEETLHKVQQMLEGVVENGTGRNIRNNHYKIAGKTGTAQVLHNGRYIRRYYTTFVGYFPAKKPKYSCIVVINEPQGGYNYGSSACAPVFKEIADKIFATDLDIHKPLVLNDSTTNKRFPVIRAGYEKDLRYLNDNYFKLPILDKSTHDEQWVRTRIVRDSIQLVSNALAQSKVPNVKGMTLRDAIYLLENQGLRVSYQGEGRVVKQSRAPGATFKSGSQIQLQLSW